MKILIFTPFALSTSHHEVGIEMVNEYLSRGWEVHVAICDGKVPTCDQNPNHRKIRCITCRSIASKSLKLAGIQKEHIHWIKRSGKTVIPEIPLFKNIEELKEYRIDSLPVGMAVAASVISGLCRDSNPDLALYRTHIKKLISTYLLVDAFTRKLCSELKPDLVYVFNGRTAFYNPIMVVAQELKIECIVGEHPTASQYTLHKNTHCIDLDYITAETLEYKKRMQDDPKAKEIAENWFLKTQQGDMELHGTFVKLLSPKQLPSGFDSSKFNIGVFCSSEDELALDPSWKNPLFENQHEAIKFLIKNNQAKNIHFYIRAHPNLAGLDCAQMRQFWELAAENTTLIPPDSQVDTYQLADCCNNVVVFGSTVGIEAAYRNKAVILVGRAQYEKLGACYIPSSKEEFLKMAQTELTPMGKEKALPYGYWYLRRGINFRFVSTQDPRRMQASMCNGHGLMNPARWVRVLLTIQYYIISGIQWLQGAKGR